MTALDLILLTLAGIAITLGSLHFLAGDFYYGIIDALEVQVWRVLHRKKCPDPLKILRKEVVCRNTAFQCQDFRIEHQAIDIRAQCPKCGKVHQLHTVTSVRIPTQ